MQFRKLDGKPYTAGSARRSIISALSANGIFGTNGKKEDRVFYVNEVAAAKWIEAQSFKFKLKKEELGKKPRKY